MEQQDERFRKLLVDFSDWYDGRGNLNMLKVLFRDSVNDQHRLDETEKTIDLLNMLVGTGNLDSKNLTLLCATIEATEQHGLLKEIELPLYTRKKVISKFSDHRLKLMKLGMALSQDDIAKISRMYKNTERKAYTDSWSLILDLEQGMMIQDKKIIMDKFTKMLKQNKVAVDALGIDNEISDEDFRQLLDEISEWYDHSGDLNMLKVLFSDHVKEYSRLIKASKTMDLLNLLRDYGSLSSDNLTLLYETIEATDQHELMKKIKGKLPLNPLKMVISKFSYYRLKLLKLGKTLATNDINVIGRMYTETKRKKYKDSWNLILDLENKKIIKDNKETMTEFIEKLKKHKLHTALAALGVELEEQKHEEKLWNCISVQKALLMCAVVIACIGIYDRIYISSPTDSYNENISRSSPGNKCNEVTIVSRSDWGARPPKSTSKLSVPVQFVFIHHTAGPRCNSQSSCIKVVRGIQTYHMEERSEPFDDIGYSFLIGEDGKVYEGRGWDRVGAHTKDFNSVGISISFMGNFSTKKPNNIALNAAKNLINCGVSLGKVSKTYTLRGHRDMRPTISPGDQLYAEIKTWPHY